MDEDHTTRFIDPVFSIKKGSAEVQSYMDREKTYTATTLGGQRLCDSWYLTHQARTVYRRWPQQYSTLV
jgi:hypothetical protein